MSSRRLEMGLGGQTSDSVELQPGRLQCSGVLTG